MFVLWLPWLPGWDDIGLANPVLLFTLLIPLKLAECVIDGVEVELEFGRTERKSFVD